MPLVTCSGRQTKAPPLADDVHTRVSKDQGATESDVDDNQTRSRAGPKSAMDAQTQDHPHPRPKARPLPRSERSGPMTSSAEDEMFFSNFARHSSFARKKSLTRKKSSDVNESPEVQLADGSALMQAEFSVDGSTNGANDNESSARPGEDSTLQMAESKLQFHPTFRPTVNAVVLQRRTKERDAVPSNGECDGTTFTSEREKTAVASTTVHLRRSGAHKSYTPDHESEPAESSDSDSDWATAEEKLSANGKQKGPAAAANHGDDAEGCNEEDTSEDEDVITHKAGRLSKEGVLKAEEFGKKVMAEATAIGKEFGKHWRVILIEAGLATKATRKESPWNQHQAWFPTILPLSKEPNLASWKVKQKVHYHDHSYRDPNHEPLWKEIRHHWDSVVASPEGLSSRESSSLMTAVREAFAKSVSVLW
ncbi:hypothetical protein K503DRAFT_805350 [Rhizopogon vinicolor AM-OR11-026]|uniref:Uncharacterized protein n=1 Tax=Rhizopogon vinicolor AM-OR11-026 TaxID=1314800 RepID=A0A1B7MI54_9AGAM|nr:hypothetical protein K503DRAFT_805350 [Rhizopogon vinicolor AM-OR11-026]